MTLRKPTSVVYVTQSAYQRAEIQALWEHGTLPDGTRIQQAFLFDLREVSVKEVLEIDLVELVTAEVRSAYGQIKVPCIVEHAGLVFEQHLACSYPGGLTKPMWNALGDSFVPETRMDGKRALARAVVAYCDGKSIHTFSGETWGTICYPPRGRTGFYWDTVFVPDDPITNPRQLTYAEIVDDPLLGLPYKMTQLSQSSRAMEKFLEHRRRYSPELWSRV